MPPIKSLKTPEERRAEILPPSGPALVSLAHQLRRLNTLTEKERQNLRDELARARLKRVLSDAKFLKREGPRPHPRRVHDPAKHCSAELGPQSRNPGAFCGRPITRDGLCGLHLRWRAG